MNWRSERGGIIGQLCTLFMFFACFVFSVWAIYIAIKGGDEGSVYTIGLLAIPVVVITLYFLIKKHT
jgi:hypothetical protein